MSNLEFFGTHIDGPQDAVYMSEEKKEFLKLMETNADMKVLATMAQAKGFAFEYMEDKRELESNDFSEEEYKQQWLGPDIDGKHIVAAVLIKKEPAPNKSSTKNSRNNRNRRRKKKGGGTTTNNGNVQNDTTTQSQQADKTNKKKIIGVISFGIADGLDHIKSVAVAPAFKGRKIGTLLVCLAQVHLVHCFAKEESEHTIGLTGVKKKIILFVEGGAEKEYVKKFYTTLGYTIADEENLGVACYGAESSCGHYMMCSDAFQPGYLTRVLKRK